AMLVPTTILAEQHVRTFRERMAQFPIRIECLSRFCTPKEEAEILQGLAEGAVDIVIGTHRLVQSDVRFHNLGLVIIDEEQRFGVEIKERLKSFRQTVDVLTMTATPIPRTLHMALVGLRDISTLRTPPQDRFAVETRVCRFDPHLIRQAVLRELNRHGQIYFVHNRVKDIDAVYRILRQIVPEARIRVAHAQMPDHQLEEIMLAFVRHEFDLLLTTTIIESGLDIPSANTIFIDMAERFGLADLHQLRGRVGRYKHRAYCYLLIHPHQRLNPNARRRLQAIEEYSELGAGFALAMRDLEIRGAGNILGTEQSGHIAAVGYELYCELLEQAVRRLKKLPPATSIDVDVDLPCQAYLPDSYIPDIR
ncbi:MAG: DEAD/DEAH box helicase, partial [Synergistales bacterium]|nr:DEAD/DEAH box helicase [Synergistales bacterium]